MENASLNIKADPDLIWGQILISRKRFDLSFCLRLGEDQVLVSSASLEIGKFGATRR